MHLPNVLLAGAPKCGTTSVYDWLVEHPKVSGGIEKELFYLMDKEDWKFNSKRNYMNSGDEGYSKLFKKDNDIVVDGTTLTIYQDQALNYAAKNNVKVIIFIREPAARVYSTFKYLKNNRSLLSSDIGFKDYLNMIDDNYKFNGNNQLSDAIKQSKYVDYIEKWCGVLGDEQVKIFVFEEFILNPSEGMKEMCLWLGIDECFFEGFEFVKKNESLNIKSRNLNLIKEAVSPFVPSGSFKSNIKNLYYKLNSARANKYEKESDAELIDGLKERFFYSNKALEERFELDLSVWDGK